NSPSDSSSSSDPKREMLRHCLATIAYRGGKAIRNAPPAFAEFRPPEGARTPGEILAHIGDLFDWALSIASGKAAWKDSKPLPWEKETERFFTALKGFDDYLASPEPLHSTPEKLFQGAVADSLTHIGQIGILRRMAGAPVRGESYFHSNIAVGRVGAEQVAPKREF
ncbi:MAG: hypothetical protein WCC95_17040, partial [Candidatus Sulfotelmatobacter sp.]